MSNWFTRLFWVDKEEKKLEFKREVPEAPSILFRCNLTPDPRENFTVTIAGTRSGTINNLHELLAEHAKLFAVHYRENRKMPNGFCHVPLNAHMLPVWKVEYMPLLVKHAHYYGLKIFKPEGHDEWVIARCFDCDSCPRRIDCLTEEP